MCVCWGGAWLRAGSAGTWELNQGTQAFQQCTRHPARRVTVLTVYVNGHLVLSPEGQRPPVVEHDVGVADLRTWTSTQLHESQRAVVSCPPPGDYCRVPLIEYRFQRIGHALLLALLRWVRFSLDWYLHPPPYPPAARTPSHTLKRRRTSLLPVPFHHVRCRAPYSWHANASPTPAPSLHRPRSPLPTQYNPPTHPPLTHLPTSLFRNSANFSRTMNGSPATMPASSCFLLTGMA